MSKWRKRVDDQGYAQALEFGDQTILHLATGTEYNEKNIEMVVDKLNRIAELERVLGKSIDAFSAIERWDFDIMGDCVRDAQRLASKSISEIKSVLGRK